MHSSRWTPVLERCGEGVHRGCQVAEYRFSTVGRCCGHPLVHGKAKPRQRGREDRRPTNENQNTEDTRTEGTFGC
jgi:hypothetical protein